MNYWEALRDESQELGLNFNNAQKENRDDQKAPLGTNRTLFHPPFSGEIDTKLLEQHRNTTESESNTPIEILNPPP